MQIASPRVQTPRGVLPPLDLQSGPSQMSMLTGSPVSPRGMPDAIPFQGLELGYVLGRGAFGSVFQGTYNGKHVAVKVCPQAHMLQLGPALCCAIATQQILTSGSAWLSCKGPLVALAALDWPVPHGARTRL